MSRTTSRSSPAHKNGRTKQPSPTHAVSADDQAFWHNGHDTDLADGIDVSEDSLSGPEWSAPERPTIGERYVLEGPMGEGYLSTTYRALDRDSGRSVAVRVYHEQASQHRELREGLLRWASELSILDHPNLAALIDAGVDSGRLYLVTELAEGKTLQQLLSEEKRLSVEQVVTIGTQVADGLQYAHDRGIVHGDLRPDNLVIDERGRVKIFDFGLARLASAAGLLPETAIAERATYFSPDQVMGGETSPSDDVYMLGALLYETLGGTPPFSGTTVLAIATQRLVREPPSLRRVRRDVPIELDNAILRALAPTRAERYRTPSEFRKALLERELAVQTAALAPVPVYRREQFGEREEAPALQALAALVPAIATVAVVIVAFLAFTVVLPNALSIFQFASVPNVAGRTLSDATQIARTAGLDVTVMGIQPTQNQPKDTVIVQVPDAGERINRSAPVRLVVSAGMLTPDVRGMNADQARALLAREGWNPGAVRTQPHPDAPFNTVIDQIPAPGEVVANRQLVDLVVVGEGGEEPTLQVTATAGSSPEHAIDGNADTFWNAGAPAPQWIELRLPSRTRLEGIELVAWQSHRGPTIHEVWVTDEAGGFYPVHTFRGTTDDGQTLSVRLAQPADRVVRVRVHTAMSAGEVGWREIRLR